MLFPDPEFPIINKDLGPVLLFINLITLASISNAIASLEKLSAAFKGVYVSRPNYM